MFAMPQLRLIFLSFFISSVLFSMERTSHTTNACRQNVPVARQSGLSCGYHSILNSALSLPGVNKNAANEINLKFAAENGTWRSCIIKMRKEKLVKNYIKAILHECLLPHTQEEEIRKLNDAERRALDRIANAYAKAFVLDETLNILKENPKNLEERLQELVKQDRPHIEEQEIQNISHCIQLLDLNILPRTIVPAHEIIKQACWYAGVSNLELRGDNLDTTEMEILKNLAFKEYGITNACITIIDNTAKLNTGLYQEILNSVKEQMLGKDCTHSFCVRTSTDTNHKQQTLEQLHGDTSPTHWFSVTLERKNGQNKYLFKDSMGGDYINHHNSLQLIEALEQQGNNASIPTAAETGDTKVNSKSKNESFEDEDKADPQCTKPAEDDTSPKSTSTKTSIPSNSVKPLSIEQQKAFCNAYGKSLKEVEFAYEHAPSQVKILVDKITRPHRYLPGFYRSCIFLGDPGVGKTTLAIAIGLMAKKLAGWCFEFFTHSDFDAEGRNATGIKLKETIEEIVKRGKKTIVSIDELHKLLENSNDKHYDTANTSSTLWTFLDHQRFNENFYFIGCMNEADKMPEPLKDRMCTNYMRLPSLTLEMKRDMFRNNLKNDLIILHDDCTDEFINELLPKLVDWSGRNMEGFVHYAFDLARLDDFDNHVVTIKKQHLEAACQYVIDGRDIECKCGQKEESEAKILHRESLEHSAKLQKENLEHSRTLYDLGVAQNSFLQLKMKSLDRSVQINGSISGGLNGGASYGVNTSVNGGGNIGLNIGGSGTRHIVLQSDYEEIKSGLTNKQVDLLDAILQEANMRIVTRNNQGQFVPINRPVIRSIGEILLGVPSINIGMATSTAIGNILGWQ